MSLVLITAMEDFIVFVSDGRVTRNKTITEVEVLQENFKKLIRLNSNLCIGFAGSKEPCEQVLKTLENYNLNNITIDNAFEVLYEKAKLVHSKYISSGVKINILMAIGGMQNREIRFKTFSSIDNFEVLRFCPKGDELNYAMLSPADVNISYLINEIKNNIPCTDDNLKRAMSECINKVSSFDKTVNNNIFVEIIKR